MGPEQIDAIYQALADDLIGQSGVVVPAIGAAIVSGFAAIAYGFKKFFEVKTAKAMADIDVDKAHIAQLQGLAKMNADALHNQQAIIADLQRRLSECERLWRLQAGGEGADV